MIHVKQLRLMKTHSRAAQLNRWIIGRCMRYRFMSAIAMAAAIVLAVAFSARLRPNKKAYNLYPHWHFLRRLQ